VAFCLLFTYSQKAARIDGVLFCQAFLFTLDRKKKASLPQRVEKKPIRETGSAD
jgi:hypothetical protein